MQCAHDPLFDADPRTGAGIEVFYADRTLETFGRCGAGWCWWCRRRGFSPGDPPTGPFPTSYAAYRHAMARHQLDGRGYSTRSAPCRERSVNVR
jgi:hypothetical protein